MNIYFFICYFKFINDFQKTYFKDLLGCDQRFTYYPNIIKEDNTSQDIIIQIYKNKTILDLLKSNHTTIQTKLDIIGETFEERINSGIFNLYEGGLLNDWNIPNIAE